MRWSLCFFAPLNVIPFTGKFLIYLFPRRLNNHTTKSFGTQWKWTMRDEVVQKSRHLNQPLHTNFDGNITLYILTATFKPSVSFWTSAVHHCLSRWRFRRHALHPSDVTLAPDSFPLLTRPDQLSLLSLSSPPETNIKIKPWNGQNSANSSLRLSPRDQLPPGKRPDRGVACSVQQWRILQAVWLPQGWSYAEEQHVQVGVAYFWLMQVLVTPLVSRLCCN